MENTIEFEFKLRIATSVAQGLSYHELMQRFSLSYSELKTYKQDADFQTLVMEIVEDNRTSAYYRLIASSKMAVEELISFLGNGELTDREQLSAINLVLSLSLDTEKKGRDSTAVTKIKGYARKNIDDIKEAILGKPV